MPPLIAFAGALGGLAFVRWVYRTAVSINHELEEARRSRLAEATRVDPAARAFYDRGFGLYRKLYQDLRESYTAISRLVAV